MALSSAELWHDVLQRLSELQQSQIVLAQAIAELGTMVRESMATGSGPALTSPPVHELELGTVRREPEVTLTSTVAPVAVSGEVDGGAIGLAPDPVGPLPDDVIAAFYPSEAEAAPWYKRRLTLRIRRRRSATANAATLGEDWPSLPPPPQVLPPPPPAHLVDRYALDTAPQAAPFVASSEAPLLSAPAPEPVPSPAPPFVEPPLAPEPAVAATLPNPVVVEPVLADPVVPRPLVYTPSNAETAMSFEFEEPVPPVATPLELDEPAAPMAIPFELDPPQAIAAHDVPVVPVAPAAPAVSAEPTASEPAPVGALAGRPVVEAQMSVSMATEILGSAVAAAPPAPAGEPAPLVISEDLTLVSKNHRKRRQFRFR
jgi:hypothetical protein